MPCGCTEEHQCTFCGNCLPHKHERVLRISDANPSRQFFVDPTLTFVNPGWNDTPRGDNEWWWYLPERSSELNPYTGQGKLTMRAICWRRAIP